MEGNNGAMDGRCILMEHATGRTRQGALDAERLHAKQREATLTGERDAALQRVAELEATVARLQAQLAQALADKAFYMRLWIDSQKGG